MIYKTKMPVSHVT